MKDKTIYQMCICNLRYAQARDNHLAPATAVENIQEAIDEIKGKAIKKDTIEQIVSEIENDLKMYDREYKQVWETFLSKLKYDLTNYARYGII
jgi:hypothetical protein